MVISSGVGIFFELLVVEASRYRKGLGHFSLLKLPFLLQNRRRLMKPSPAEEHLAKE
jgi:hypothetical protein